MRSVRIAAGLLALLAAAGCSTRPHDPKRVRVGDLSVVWITLDAAGARYLGAYGNPLPTSPSIDALAQDGGTVFERAYAQSAWTLPSTASFLTGRYPARRRQVRTRVSGETVATQLRAAGFATAAFSANPYVTSTYGFDRGFDVLEEYFPEALLHQSAVMPDFDGERVTTDALAWLEANADRRTFLYLHLLTPHSPYQPPPPFAGRFDPDYTGAVEPVTDTLLKINGGLLDVSERDLEHLRLRYQEHLAYGDHQVGRVVEALRRAGRLDRTIVIIGSDHGEAFREHGRMLHTTTVFEEMIHVPLVIRMPRRFGRMPPRFTGIVELRDLAPTVCHALHLRCEVGTARSLIRLLRARTRRDRIARSWTSDGTGRVLGAIMTPQRKLIMDVPQRLLVMYDLRIDGHEGWNLAPTEPARARHLARRLRAPKGTDTLRGAPVAVDEETERKLRAIGYID